MSKIERLSPYYHGIIKEIASLISDKLLLDHFDKTERNKGQGYIYYRDIKRHHLDYNDFFIVLNVMRDDGLIDIVAQYEYSEDDFTSEAGAQIEFENVEPFLCSIRLLKDYEKNIKRLLETILKDERDKMSDELFIDGTIVRYKNIQKKCKEGCLTYAFLKLLTESPNFILSVDYFIQSENSLSVNKKKKFKDKKALYDVYNNLKKKLGVKKGEYFPISYRSKGYYYEKK